MAEQRMKCMKIYYSLCEMKSVYTSLFNLHLKNQPQLLSVTTESGFVYNVYQILLFVFDWLQILGYLFLSELLVLFFSKLCFAPFSRSTSPKLLPQIQNLPVKMFILPVSGRAGRIQAQAESQRRKTWWVLTT